MIISGYLSCLFRLTVSKWNIVCSKNLYRNSSVISFNDYIRKFRFKTTYPRVNKLTIITLNTLLTSLASSPHSSFFPPFSLWCKEKPITSVVEEHAIRERNSKRSKRIGRFTISSWRRAAGLAKEDFFQRDTSVIEACNK